MAYHTLRLIVLDAANKCPELSIANAKKITYSDPKGPNGKRDEGSIATYTCKNGFKKAGNKDKRECKKGKFDGAEQLCVGSFCVEEGSVRANTYFVSKGLQSVINL